MKQNTDHKISANAFFFQEFDYSELKRQAEENLKYVLDAIRNENAGFWEALTHWVSLNENLTKEQLASANSRLISAPKNWKQRVIDRSINIALSRQATDALNIFEF